MMAATKNDMVSIVIPAFNAERYLEETVTSALASTYPLLEVIVVNDGSTDSTQLVIEGLARRHPRVRGFFQENRGTAAALNRAVSLASGEYLLPLGADDLISNDYMEKAVAILGGNERVKLVYGEAEFFGDRTGRWKLPPFDRHLLARKNIVYACGVFRRADFDKAGGFCEEIIGREDWDFWISLLKRDGEVVRIPSVCFYYRIHANSRRKATRNRKRELIDILNTRHKAFFYRELGGRLHYMRTWSRFLNMLIHLFYPERVHCSPSGQDLEEFVYTSPERFDREPGSSTAGGGNTRIFDVLGRVVTVTRYDEPAPIRQLLRGGSLLSRAGRSFQDAEKLLAAGTAVAQPVGFYEKRTAFWCSRSYYVSAQL
jgi:glycosyltransferase involved in cell wall biosynthesis